MGQSYSFPKSLVEHSPREILTSRRFSFKPVTVVSSLDDEDYEFYREVTQGRDYTSYLPNELLVSIFHFLGAGDRKQSSLVYHRWLRVDDQIRHCLSLNAQAGLLPFLPTFFARFDSVTKLALQCDHKSISLDDDALVLWVFEIRKLIRRVPRRTKLTPLFFLIVLLLCCLGVFMSANFDLASKRGVLLALRNAVGGRIMGWNVTETNPCSWLGVKCESDRVTELQLPGWALVGQLPLGLKNLTQLLTLSLCINALFGPLPNDLVNLVNLKNLYLQGESAYWSIPELGLPISLRLHWAFMDGSMWLHHPRTAKLKDLVSDPKLFGQIDIAQFQYAGTEVSVRTRRLPRI
ncbi:hypothetical protein ACFX1S_035194 [Malus domestica]